MTLKFSEDFETSTIIFTQCVEREGDYHLMIPEVVSMIQNIEKTGSLPPEYGDVQNRFIDEVIVAAITPILQLSYTSGTELKNDLSFFQECMRFIPWCIKNNHITTTLKIIEILHSRQPFYTPYSNHPQSYAKAKETYNKVLNAFLQANVVNIVHEMMKNEEKTFYNYSIYFALLSYGHTEINKTIRSSEIQEIIMKFYEFSKSSNIREFDQFHLKLILEIIQKLTDCLIYDTNLQLTENINFLIYLLNLDILDKQLIASRILASYFQASNYDSLLKELLNKSDFSNFILKPELHEEVLEILAPVIIKIMNPELLKSFYEVATKSHVTRQKIMFKTIETSLAVMDTDDLMKLIDIFDLSTLHPSLLAGLVPTIATKDKDKAKNIISQILNLSEDGEEVLSHLNPILKCDNQNVKEICKESITEHLDNPSTSLVSVLKSCVTDKIFDESLIPVIFNQILKNGNQMYFSLLTMLYVIYDKPITTETVQELAQLRQYPGLGMSF
ncbi:ubiquitinyl hydrolase protein, partial [Trichomonas vaginalis G3]|uniref:ubiquitinyl hydrolase protein n=1 Tax=Trichomonas vaginalis (strain ATCC PRA-98 / G3) TaxID=412133 RepID=UPI0021E5AAD9